MRRRRIQSSLATAALGCALALSASSTVRLVADVGVPGWAHPFAIGMLEVLAITSTWLLLTEPRLRIESAVGVVLAAGVTATGGVLAYGLFGVVAPACSLIVVHLIARAWSADDGSRVREATVEEPTLACTPVLEPEMAELPAAELHVAEDQAEEEDPLDTVRQIVANGGGRGTVATELGITRDQARYLIDKVRAA